MKNKKSIFLMIFTVIAIAFISLGVMNNPSVSVSSNGISPIIVIDAGHGGPDGGTKALDGTLEKDINLNIALKLNDVLVLMGYDTVNIRTTDTDISDKDKNTIREKKVSDIHNRLNIVNSYDNSMLVSIHQNFFESSVYSGTQVFYSANNLSSQLLADSIQKNVVKSIQPDNTRVIKPSGDSIYILYHAQKPSVMVECGFLSNAKEAENLKNESYCRQMAFSIAMGIEEFNKSKNFEKI